MIWWFNIGKLFSNINFFFYYVYYFNFPKTKNIIKINKVVILEINDSRILLIMEKNEAILSVLNLVQENKLNNKKNI